MIFRILEATTHSNKSWTLGYTNRCDHLLIIVDVQSLISINTVFIVWPQHFHCLLYFIISMFQTRWEPEQTRNVVERPQTTSLEHGTVEQVIILMTHLWWDIPSNHGGKYKTFLYGPRNTFKPFELVATQDNKHFAHGNRMQSVLNCE